MTDKIVTSIRVTDFEIECPHCGEIETGFVVDPRGGKYQCDECNKEYKVHKDATIEDCL